MKKQSKKPEETGLVRLKFLDLITLYLESMNDNKTVYLHPEVYIIETKTSPSKEININAIMLQGMQLKDFIQQSKGVDAIITTKEPLGIGYYWTSTISKTLMKAYFILFLKDDPSFDMLKIFKFTLDPKATDYHNVKSRSEIASKSFDFNMLHPIYTINPFECNLCRKCRFLSGTSIYKTDIQCQSVRMIKPI
jgi:hypothetical protein